MTSDRIQRQIERLLDEADAAFSRRDWDALRDTANDLLSLDPENVDARTYLAAAERNLDREPDASSTEAPAPASEAVPTPSAQPTSFANGRYDVRRFLGEGGKKRVYLAHDAQLDRDVAFALIKTEGLDEAARTRVTREAQAMGRLGSHPHIVTVYDIGEERMPGPSGPGASSAQPYLVLPVLPGGDVEGVIEKAEEHRLPIEQAVKIATETCLGLEFAHSKGIIHRDLKPGNVWLAEDGRAMIGDFGLAVAVDRSRLTQAGMMVGTVNYMPPEQAMGGEVTPQSDLYSLGAMLYEMVCGRPPFVGDESVAIIGQHLNTPPVAPTWHRPDCPPGLEALILRLLEKDATKRPGSASEVREALAALDSAAAAVHEPATDMPAALSVDPLYRRTFVGRENETRQLHQAYDAAVSGQGGLVMVVGEPGIGKTALCEQLATYVQLRGGRTLVGHCYEEGSMSLPYLAFVEAMRTYVLDRDPDSLKSELGTGAGEVARIVSEVRDKVPVELRDASDPEDDRWRLLNSVTTFLRNAAAVQPLVIVLEDLHWADRGTLDLLQHVARNLSGARLVVVGTYRDVEVDRTHPLSGTLAELRRTADFIRVTLRGLTVDEVHRMYEAVRGNDIPWAQAEAVHRQTEGNPLFVQEVLRFLVEEGYVVREGARYVGQGLGVGIPEGLRDVVGRRLNRLGDKANSVLSVAAVIGREFRLDVLQVVLNTTDEDLFPALEEAQERAIIEQRDLLGTIGFRFTHAFFRQTLYEEIFAPRRIRLHQQVGRALEDVYARRLEEHAAELAEHFSQSTEPSDLEKAVRYGALAAHRALAVYAHGEATKHLEQALRAQEVLNPDDGLSRCDLLIALIEPLSMSGEPLRAFHEVAEEAYRLAEAEGDNRRALAAFRAADQAISRYNPTGHPDRREWAERADRLAQPGTVDRVYADFVRSRVTGRLYSSEASSLRREAFILARQLGDIQALFRVGLFRLIEAWRVPRNWPDSLEVARDAESWPREGVGSTALGHVLFQIGMTYYSHGETEAAFRHFDAIADLGGKTNDENLVLLSMNLQSFRTYHEGNFDESLRHASEMSIRAREAGMNAAAYNFFLIWLMIHRGALGDHLLTGSSTRPEDANADNERDSPRLQRAYASAANGLSTEARTLLEDWAATTELESAPSDFLALALVTAIELKHSAIAVDISRVLDPMAGAITTVSFGRLLAESAWLLHNPQQARSYFETSIATCTKSGHRPELAICRGRFAELLLDHYPDEREAALEHLDFAIAEFRDMKMQPALERALGRRGLLRA